MKKTAYQILGVNSDATHEEIDAAYGKLSVDPVTVMPRADDEHERKQKILREAYELIATPAQRAAYDASLRRLTLARPEENQTWCTPGVMYFVVAAFFVGSAFWGKYLYDARQAEQVAEENRLEQEHAAQLKLQEERIAAAEEQRLRAEAARSERQVQREMDQARYEGRYISDRMQRADYERERREAYERERQARYEEQQARAQEQQAAYQRRYEMERRTREVDRGPAVSIVPPPRRTLSDPR